MFAEAFFIEVLISCSCTKFMLLSVATIKGFEVMRALKKQQARSLNFSGNIRGEIRIIERAFGLGNDVMANMMNEREIRLKAA